MTEKIRDTAEPVLSSTQENYLKYLYEEELANGYGRGCDLSEKLGVSRSTVATQMRGLKALGLIDYEPYHPLRLTPAGRRIGMRILGRNAVLKAFFSAVLRLSDEQCSALSCELEHIVTSETLEKAAAITVLAKRRPDAFAEALSKCDLKAAPAAKSAGTAR